MKVETLSFQEILKHTPDIFEAVVVLGERASQINARRMAENTLGEEDYIEEDFLTEEPVENEDYQEEDKSTVLAMGDFLEHRLSWHYAEKDTGEDPDKSEEKTTS
ncbi:MAG: hypothetical protein V3W14_12380 [Candidatus Neomarinimicrobiota bacterium]